MNVLGMFNRGRDRHIGFIYGEFWRGEGGGGGKERRKVKGGVLWCFSTGSATDTLGSSTVSPVFKGEEGKKEAGKSQGGAVVLCIRGRDRHIGLMYGELSFSPGVVAVVVGHGKGGEERCRKCQGRGAVVLFITTSS